MKLEHRVASHKKNPDGSVLVSLSPVAGSMREKKMLIYKEHVDETLARFLKGDGAGIYFGAEVSDKHETVVLRFIGYFYYDKNLEERVFQDVYTPSKDFRLLLGERCIVGEILS